MKCQHAYTQQDRSTTYNLQIRQISPTLCEYHWFTFGGGCKTQLMSEAESAPFIAEIKEKGLYDEPAEL